MVMLSHDRQRAILERLAHQHRFTVDALQNELDVSRSTLQRDLRELESRGEVVRVHGGVVHPQHVGGESTLRRRSRQNLPAKRKIASAAAALVPRGTCVFIDAGSTAMSVGMQLLTRRDLRIFTNNVSLLAAAIRHGSDASVTAIGGEVREVSCALVGGASDTWLGRLRFDYAVIGASGLDRADGASTTELSESAVKSSVLERSRHSILVCDASKCKQPAAIGFADWNAFDHWVVDRRPPRGFGSVACKVLVADS